MKLPGRSVRKNLFGGFLNYQNPYSKGLVIRKLPIGTVQNVVDVGAHFGMVSVLAKFLHPDARVVAVEANSINFGILKENIGHLPIEAVNCAIGKNGKAYHHQPSGSSLQQEYDSKGEGDDWVTSMSLASLFEKYSVETNGLYIKIDIQGAEHHFLDQPETIELFQKTVGIDMDLHRSSVVADVGVYYEWLQKHLSNTHEIDPKLGLDRRGGVFLIRKGIV